MRDVHYSHAQGIIARQELWTGGGELKEAGQAEQQLAVELFIRLFQGC